MTVLTREEGPNAPSVLIAYGSKHGSTKEVVDFVADGLTEAGCHVVVSQAKDVKNVAPFAAVIVAAPLYAGRWSRDVTGFCKHYQHELAARKVAFFALGPTCHPDEAGWKSVEGQLQHVLAKLPSEVHPVTVGLFGGVVAPEKLHFPFNRMPGGDWRDWEAIRAWTLDLARALSAEAVPVRG